MEMQRIFRSSKQRFLASPSYDEEVISDTGQEQTTCDEYPDEDDEEHCSPMVPVYYDCESDPWESHEGEREKLNAQFISCSETVNEQISPGTSQPVYDNYESDSELDMKDFQEHTTESYPLFNKEKYCEEINHPWPAEVTEQ
jgi:hypothetical protein